MAREFSDTASAATWLSVTFAPWHAALTAPERKAIERYKLRGERSLNAPLRRGAPLDLDTQATIEDLDVALRRMRLPESVITHRGFDAGFFSVDPGSMVGRSFTTPGYLSTSLLQKVAIRFASPVPGGTPVLARLTLPGGMAVGAFAGAPDLVRDMSEAEILLPRNTTLAIVSYRAPTRDNPHHILELEVKR